MERLVREVGDDHLADVAPSSSSVGANRSWVSGRSGVSPWSRIAIAFASHGPIQIGRYRSRPSSLRMTTCWVESMCTRTLSTAISIQARRPCAGLSHAGRRGPRPAESPADGRDVARGPGAGGAQGLGVAFGFVVAFGVGVGDSAGLADG